MPRAKVTKYKTWARKLYPTLRIVQLCHSNLSCPQDISSLLNTTVPIYPSYFPRRQVLDSSKLKELADDKFKFDENDRKLSKRVENTVGKGEIARYEQFLLFPQCFQKACFPGASKGVIVWEWVNP